MLWCLTSAIIEHTNQVIYLEDNDVAAVNRQGQLTIHRIRRSYDDPHASAVREVITLRMEIQQIMKGLFVSELNNYFERCATQSLVACQNRQR